MNRTTAGTVSASHYQFVICDDPERTISDEDNWPRGGCKPAYAGNQYLRLVGTHADSNLHWVEVELASRHPGDSRGQQFTRMPFHSETGRLHVMSAGDREPTLSLDLTQAGDYTLHVAVHNAGFDAHSLGEECEPSGAELSSRRDLEWYRILVVPAGENKTVDGEGPDEQCP